ncbi:MAG: response regulator [Deltaproteobacteria bacterium]|nr:response regulator [Deltaproteobacteria bacterium]
MEASTMKNDKKAGQKDPGRDKLSLGGATRKNLIVIDDDQGMRLLLSEVFGSLGYTVSGFSDAVGALKTVAVAEKDYDAIICDLNMPRISGLSFLSMLKKMGSTVPLILITAFGTGKIEREAKSLGAFAYLSKPFQLSELSELVRQATEKKETHD